jgi:glutamate synthase (NADPH) large chain
LDRWQEGGFDGDPVERDACGVGFVAHGDGHKSHGIVQDALEVLRRLRHRAACGFDPDTGDGAGILLQIPHGFFLEEAERIGFELPPNKRYGVGQVFLPSDPDLQAYCQRTLTEVTRELGQQVMGWRDVPIDLAHVGATARAVMPVIGQVFVSLRRVPPTAFESTLYRIRKLTENRIRESGFDRDGRFHMASFSSETMVYKGLLLPDRLADFYTDLRNPKIVSALAMVHSRFSTNTFPTWELAQPMRYVAHNGEINTLQGNRNWMRARRSQLASAKLGGALTPLFPIIVPGKSDSAQFDNMLELLHLGGRTLAHAMMMMIPEAWEGNALMDKERRDFYEYTSTLMEPWDGPAAIVFTDGQVIGATLDRNGLRPARYVITKDQRIILASEAGVIDVPEDQIERKGRLTPGRMLLVDTQEGEILDDDALKHEIARRFPYGRWLSKNVFDFESISPSVAAPRWTKDALRVLQRAFGYTDETLRLLIGPMAESGKEPVGSMGTDTPLAILSGRAPNLFEYFHQLFAQVTNPPIDPIRESLVMSLGTWIGPSGNTLEETPEQCHRIRLPGPILTNEALARIAGLKEQGVFAPIRISAIYEDSGYEDDLSHAVLRLCRRAVRAVEDGYNILILSDRGVDATHVGIPALLALSAVHQRLVRDGTRMQVGLVVETGEVREVHDLALLIGYGAAAVNPYLALDTVAEMASEGLLSVSAEEAERNYIEAAHDGLLKIMSKMGISTLRSYRGAQIFEAVGLSTSLIDEHFSGTPSRLGGVGLAELGQEALTRHRRGFGPEAHVVTDPLPVGGVYQWRRRGEHHKWNPATVAKLQLAVRTNDAAAFDAYSQLVDQEDEAQVTLRGLLDIVSDRAPVPIDEVVPASEIVKRFVTGAMSLGSISPEAHETMAIAMNRIGGRSNSGEGGEELHRFVADPNGDLRRSAIKQVASARFGVTAYYLSHADDLQIKIAQGAKPGEGGQLPGHKVNDRIAKVRHSTAGVTLISPPPHHDIYSIEDLAQLVYDLQAVNREARVSVKLVSEFGVGTVAAGVAKAHAGCVVIAGDSGGTGAAPLSSLKHAGLPWELGLSETQRILVENRLRDRVRVQVDGGLRTARDVVIAALMGAEEFGVATAALIATGCIMLRKCHLNTCSVGIATQDPELRAKFQGTPEHVVQFFFLLANGVRAMMANLGFRSVEEMVGRVDCLVSKSGLTGKAARIDLAAILAKPKAPESWPRSFVQSQPWDLIDHFDHKVIEQWSLASHEEGQTLKLEYPIRNCDRAVGAMLSGLVARRYGPQGLPRRSIVVRTVGTAGQSYGAFLANGITLELIGESNDYLGKGLSGGQIIVLPPSNATRKAEENIIVGNTVLYGATSGEAFIAGQAGERFAVRNSGARAVVEGVGDHGCEYMTGGTVVILGPTGRNFAAGMSGGIAYVFDREDALRTRANLLMVGLESLEADSDVWVLRSLIEDHLAATGSVLARRILENWEVVLPRFVKVVPHEFRQAIERQRESQTEHRRPPRLQVVGGGV